MTKVIADITMSLDGFVTGPNAGPKAGLGDDGMPMHDWVFNGHEVDEAVLVNATQRSGAVVMGRNLFDVVDGPDGWSDEIGYGAHNVGRPLRQSDVRVSPYATHITYALKESAQKAG